MENMMYFENNGISVPFHWSGGVIAITIVTLLVLIGTGVYLEMHKWPIMMLWMKYLLAIIFLATIIIGAGYMPIRLKVSDEKIIVNRLFGPLEIPLDKITEIRCIPESYIDNSIRTFGSGGLFGFLGRFRNDRLGNYIMYATELRNLILIRTENKKYVFCCSRSKEVIEYVHSQIEQKKDTERQK